MMLSEKADRLRRSRPRAETGNHDEKSLAIIWPSAMRFCRYNGVSGLATFVVDDFKSHGSTATKFDDEASTAQSPHCLGVMTEPVN